MSALGALYHLDGKPVEESDLQRMSAALEQHGRDAARTWRRGEIGLVHRLARYCPEDLFDHQPVVQPGRVALCLDGRLDNREELARALEIPPARLRTLADSALAMQAYERWGEGFVNHLEGGYAILIWDAQRRQLLAVRDRLGEIPLCYARFGQGLALATMPAGLFALPAIPRQIDRRAMVEFLGLLLADPEQTLFKDIKQLPPAHVLRATPEGVSLSRYWDFDPERRILFARDEDYVEAMREHLQRAVDCRLRAIGTAATTLSGGLDSSAITWMASRNLAERGQGPLTAYTVLPQAGYQIKEQKGRITDVRERTEAIRARVPNLDLRYVVTPAQPPLEHVEDWFSAADSPALNPCNQVWLEAMYRQCAKDGHRVILAGELGNRSFSWEGAGYLKELWRERRWLDLMDEAAATLRKSGWRSLKGVVAELLPEPLAQTIARLRGRGAHWSGYSALRAEAAHSHHLEDRFRAFGRDPRFLSRPDPVTQRIRFFRHASTVSFIPGYLAGMRAHLGLDVRLPAWDRRLVEFCIAVPEAQYRRHGETRWLIRRVLDGVLPDSVVWDPRREVQAADWHERLALERPGLERQIDALAACAEANALLDVDRLRRLVKAWPVDGWQTKDQIVAYRLLLQRGLAAGRFMRWVEGGNEAVQK